MKKWLSLLLVLCLLMPITAVFAEPDQPFVSGVSYGDKFDEYGAVPSMLNFGSAPKLSPGESLYDAKTKKITKLKASTLADSLEKSTYYCYAKWQFAHGFDDYNVDAMLVMTTPAADYYAMYDSWDITECTNKTICSWFFDVTDLLQRCLDDNSGTFATGTYSFSMFFNDMVFRVTKLTVK
jgi:hypothetical protein